ncbi:uncharacterized protein [Leptinotarsa decemlineata]|uniref:uncharacterized protein n=1 Tax=Leptinotarsa decemlineata TaxID=7539 RepID=UPI003D30A0DF
MRGIILSLAFLGAVLSDRLDNRYLPPPNNALIANGDYNPYPASTPIVEDAKSAKPTSENFGQTSESSGQYSAPSAKVPSRQYLFPANQYNNGGSSSFRQADVSANQYTKPNGQFSNAFHQSRPTNQLTSQFSHSTKSNGFATPTQLYKPSQSSTGSLNQYSNPNGQVHDAQHSFAPSSHSAGQFHQQSKPSGQYSGSFFPTASNQVVKAGEEVPNANGQFNTYSAGPNLQKSGPSGQYSGLLQPAALSVASEPLRQPNGQYKAYSAGVPSQYYNGASSAAPAAIIKSNIVPNSGDGYYSYNYETENGIMAQEEGTVVNDAENARGGYSYTSPEGERVVVEYTADEEGFKPTGSHIPQIPEAILKSIELNKAALARGEYQEGQYYEENEQKYAKNGQYGFDAKFASLSLNNIPSQAISSVQSGGLANGAQNGYQYSAQTNGLPQFGGFSSLQVQKSVPNAAQVPQLTFTASESSKVQNGSPQLTYGVPSFKSGTVQDTKGGYKY